jgi:hypothetical protein
MVQVLGWFSAEAAGGPRASCLDAKPNLLDFDARRSI